MAIKIRKYPDPVLLRIATDVVIGKESDKIINELRKAIFAPHWSRVLGMAAPQIGISKRVFMVGMQAFLNADMVGFYDGYETEEGCFSLEPNRFDYKVIRPARILLNWFDVDGVQHEEEFTGKQAQIISHEYDHLEGKLINRREVS